MTNNSGSHERLPDSEHVRIQLGGRELPIDKALHAALVRKAAAEGLSVESLMQRALVAQLMEDGVIDRGRYAEVREIRELGEDVVVEHAMGELDGELNDLLPDEGEPE